MDDSYSVYDHLKAHDILDSLKPLLESQSYVIRPIDGKLEVKQVQIARETPWVHVKSVWDYDCGLWHQIIFNVISQNLPKDQKFVPRHCQNCFKVVVKPRTLEQLFNLLELQKSLNRPAKCGIETRDSVHGLYGGYFYNKGLMAGLECYDAVKNGMLQNEVLRPLVDEVDENDRTTRVILKRGCTEFEHAVGDSDKWQVTDDQNHIEDLVERYVVKQNFSLSQPEHVVWHIQARWIEWAWKHGDSTYAKYTGGKPLYPAYVTYHQKELINVNESGVSEILSGV